MGNRRLLGPGLLAVGVTAAALAISRRMSTRAAARFYQRTGPRTTAAHWGVD